MTGCKIKICGLTNEAAVKAVITTKADYAGFVYFPASPRHLKLEDAAQLRTMLPTSIQSVSVLVNPDDALLKQVSEIVKPNVVQLHGKESAERVRAIKKQFPNMKIIKAITIATSDDIAEANRYSDCVDMFLFDARPPELPTMLPGGNGLSFDWILLKNRDFGKPWFLSGGLNAENVQEAIAVSGAAMVDVSSGVELSPGKKDSALIAEFVKTAQAT